MWQDKVKEVIDILENSNVNEIEVTFWGRKIRVVKNASNVISSTSSSSDLNKITSSNDGDCFDQNGHNSDINLLAALQVNGKCSVPSIFGQISIQNQSIEASIICSFGMVPYNFFQWLIISIRHLIKSFSLIVFI